MKSVTVVIPTLNEESSIVDVLRAIAKNPRITNIIIIDDSSNDRTCELVLHYAAKDSRVQLIERHGARSFAESYRDGFLRALENGADYIIQMDGDGSHPPDTIDAMLDTLEMHDFVVGSRFIRGSSSTGRTAVRRMVSSLGNGFARLMLNIDIRDMTGGFNGWHAEVVRELLDAGFPYRGFAIQIWLKQQGARHHTWKEIPIHFTERRRGASKFTLDIFREGVAGIIRMRFNEMND